MTEFPSFLKMICHIFFFIHLSINKYLGCFHILLTLNNAAMHMWVWIVIWDSYSISFGYIPRSWSIRSYGGSIYFLRNFRTIFHNSCTNLHSHQRYLRVLFYSHPLQNLLSFDFLVTAILTGVRWFLVVLIDISLIFNDVEHRFMYLLDIYISSLDIWLFVFFAHL